MSCQQASRFNNSTISSKNNNNNNNDNNIQQQHLNNDPYVFTETVPTLPSAYFNAQKLRVRSIEVNPSITTNIAKFRTNTIQHHKQQQQQQQQHQNSNSNIVNVFNGKNAEILAAAPTTTTPTTVESERHASYTFVIDANANQLKNCKTSVSSTLEGIEVNHKKQTIQQQLTTTTTSSQLQNNKKLTNVCIVRPQQQQQQHNDLCLKASLAVEDIKCLSPSSAALSPLYTPPTSSLWQTPLLLDPIQEATIQPTQQSLTTVNVSSCGVASRTLSVTMATPSCGGIGFTGNAVVTTTTTTTAMAKVAPIVVHTVPPTNVYTTKLPPSKFHQHTMAQQLQKVEILKKPIVKASAIAQPPPPPLQALVDVTPVKHSKNKENLKNEIPVKVIYRMAIVSPDGQMSSNSMKSEQKSALPQPESIKATKKNLNKKDAEYSLPISNDLSLSKTLNNNHKTMSSIESSDQKNLQLINDLGNNASNNCYENKAATDNKSIQLHKSVNNGNKNDQILPSIQAKKKSRLKSILNLDYPTWQVGSTLKGAVAVVKVPHCESANNNNSVTALVTNLPYCVQQNWLKNDIVIEAAKTTVSREERIVMNKQQLRRQAEQLLSIRCLQKLPLRLAKKRLLCVKRLLNKYDQQKKNGPLNRFTRCCINGCNGWCIEMASHCQKHIGQNATQQIFVPCTAKFANNSQCKTFAFDVTHDLPLCTEHARKRDAYDRCLNEQKPRRISPATVLMPEPQARQSKEKQLHKQSINGNDVHDMILSTNGATARKRKLNTINSTARPQKRSKKAQTTININTSIPSSSSSMKCIPSYSATVLKRKSSATSLDSITSSSHHSTCSSSSTNFNQIANSKMEKVSSPPALVPLSTGGNGPGITTNSNFGLESNYKHSYHRHHHDVNDLVNSYTMPNHNYQKQHNLNLNVNNNSNSNFTSSGVGSTASLTNCDEFLTQDMLSICENSSACSEDTGLGGLSDPELMLSAGTDADDIPLGDTPLLEEHDLDNVLGSLPEDTFKELFATVHQDESDEIERAIEIADKNLKTLQQTIGSSLGDFLNFNDDILADASDFVNVTTANLMDTSTLFMDSSFSGSNKGSSDSSLTEYRELVQA